MRKQNQRKRSKRYLKQKEKYRKNRVAWNNAYYPTPRKVTTWEMELPGNLQYSVQPTGIMDIRKGEGKMKQADLELMVERLRESEPLFFAMPFGYTEQFTINDEEEETLIRNILDKNAVIDGHGRRRALVQLGFIPPVNAINVIRTTLLPIKHTIYAGACYLANREEYEITETLEWHAYKSDHALMLSHEKYDQLLQLLRKQYETESIS